MDKLTVYFKKNWKTTVAAVALGVVAIFSNAGVIDPAQHTMIVTILAALGFTAAKDANQTGV